MQVKLCEEKNVQRVGDFYNEVVLYLTQTVNYPKWQYKSYPSLQTVEAATRQGTQYLCLDSDKIVGAFVLNSDPQGSYGKAKWSKYIAEGSYLVIHSFATHPTVYRKGVGAKMLQFCLEKARELKMQALRLDVVPSNYPAKVFYEKHGFSFVEELDLNRGFEDIPTFCLYEYNFSDKI